MDFIEIVFDRPLPTDVDRDDVEDDLNEALEGLGEVTGAGTGLGSSNLDVDPGANRSEMLDLVFRVLADLGVGDAARVRPGDGEVWIRPSEWRPT
ncbi:hypothetical protein [Actinomadura alba]|uniref:Uncharacterized protein n=1 Tax=Actinomadura alba TaxID=406431 RepID=A0ABR7LUY2_9ACTN|nr:hypothetical protein [Actinomadura alba]MBC6468312.1 hypothetical protein [Actinomadura alba]